MDMVDVESTLLLESISLRLCFALNHYRFIIVSLLRNPDLIQSKVMAFDGVVSFGVEKLWELLSRESQRLSGIHEQVGGLKRKLRRLQSLLKDAYAKKHTSERVRSFLEDVDDIVYDVEDIIESFLLKESRREEKGIKKHVKRLACFLVDRRSFATEIEGMTKRISEVIEEMQSFGIQQIIDGGHSLSMKERHRVQREIRQTFSNSFESNLIGVEQSVEELVGRLVKNDSKFQVVSITGMGGIGKTTLARQVFRHDIVRRHFDGFTWVCVSQEFTQKHIWQRMLQDLKPRNDGENILKMDEYKLQRKLFQLLGTSRYLIVLDDVWKNEDWDRIKEVFPPKKSWKILLTSRNEGVGLHADPMCLAFRPKLLSHEESWKLCKGIVFPKSDEIEFSVDEELEVVGKKMVTYCGGLPLAVKVLGGLLATKHTVREWERVRENIGSQIIRGTTSGIVDDNNPNSVNRVLSLSYEDLPMQLKHCFLYLAHFPEDHKINVKDLFSCWFAEGIIVSCNNGSTIHETGEGYMEELVRRNMVIAERKYTISRIESFQMHDMMREVCLYKAKEENFLHAVKVPTTTYTITSQFSSRSRRFVVHSDMAFQMMRLGSNPKVKSLLCFVEGKNLRIKSAKVFRSLPLLRVLDLSWVIFEGNKLLSSIGELIHLRFLSLYKALVTHIPSSLRNLKLLLHLNLCVFMDQVHVPNVLKEMLELRYLKLPNSMHHKTKLELRNLVNLEYLWNFSVEHSSVTDLLSMTRLMTLQVVDRVTIKTLSPSLRGLRNLEKLSLFGCEMEEDPMPILEKLLHLKLVGLSHGTFVGRRMVCSKGGFPQLCALEITGQEQLVEWIVEEGSMPCLHILTINYCDKLKELSSGIKFITSLKKLQIINMKKLRTEKLVPGGEDYYKVQHIPSVEFTDCNF